MLRNMTMLLGVFLFCRMLTLHGQDEGDFIIQGTVLVKYTGEEEHVIIPANLGITEIGEKAFSNYPNYNSKIKSVVIPEGITSIGNNAFYLCGRLTDITIPESVTSIGNSAFSWCNLTHISIPRNVISIGNTAFINSHLIGITVDDNNLAYHSIDGVLFNKDKTVLIQYPAAKNEQAYAIPESVIIIGDSAFTNCGKLMSITIPPNVSYIGFSAFFGCNFSSITIPSGVTVIEPDTFCLCGNLTNIVIPEGVTSIGRMAFFGTGLTSIVIPASVTFIGDMAFQWDVEFVRWGSRLASITVDERNTAYSSIDGVLFNKDKTVLIQYPADKDNKTYVIPASVTAIEEMAFYGCRNLERITILPNVAFIGARAFYECHSLKTVLISRDIRFDRYTFPRAAEIIYVEVIENALR